MEKLKPGQKLVLSNNEFLSLCNLPVHHDTTGLYKIESGKMRHLIVAVVGYAGDWAAYEGWASLEMSLDDAIEAIAGYGDKLREELAKALLYHPLLEYRYRP